MRDWHCQKRTSLKWKYLKRRQVMWYDNSKWRKVACDKIKGCFLHCNRGKKEIDDGSTCTLVFSFSLPILPAWTVVFYDIFLDFSFVTQSFILKKGYCKNVHKVQTVLNRTTINLLVLDIVLILSPKVLYTLYSLPVCGLCMWTVLN